MQTNKQALNNIYVDF